MNQMTLSLDERANIDFVLHLRRRWADTLYPELATQVQEALSNGAENIKRTMHDQPSYPWFAWLERGSQKMLWRAVSDVVSAHPNYNSPDGANTWGLELDPDLELPQWYTDWDIHVQPGGVWRNGASARVYELGSKLVMMGENDDYMFHHTFVETAVPKRVYGRIADLGCGFGKSTWTFKQAYPEADVVGIELSAPCLRLAHEKVKAMGLDVRFRQADVCATGLEDASCHLVTATMLVHEIPLEVLPAFFRECWRLLVPGGLLRVLDFHTTGQPLRDLVMAEHGARNNEPFMPPMMAANLLDMCREAGLDEARWVAFDERGTGRLDDLDWPQRQEWHFPWAVLEAEKSA